MPLNIATHKQKILKAIFFTLFYLYVVLEYKFDLNLYEYNTYTCTCIYQSKLVYILFLVLLYSRATLIDQVD